MGLPADYVDVISYSAQMHDVGKIRFPIRSFSKWVKLDQEEMKLVRMHPVYGEKILGIHHGCAWHEKLPLPTMRIGMAAVIPMVCMEKIFPAGSHRQSG